ncbi:MAG: adenylosuccinate lyase [Clostridiales bacterium]|nr:adenylosuccinate lyase [Clostridiales bacterium]
MSLTSKPSYESPLNSRYASKEMQYIFSPDKKFKTWRLLWIALAEAEKELGLNITDEQIADLKAHKDEIDYEDAAKEEKIRRHDVMAHVHSYGKQVKESGADGIIHLGATSCYVGDNTDIIIMRDALELVKKRLVVLISKLASFADEYKAMPTLGFTHFQPAQLVTVGKRASLWLQDLVFDLETVENAIASLKLLGCKGTTGTQASFMDLFEGDNGKCVELDKKICQKMGFASSYYVSGQTYSRKIDFTVLSALSAIAQSAHKFSNDIRLLQHLKEIEEPFEKNQIGSSAMAYKRNPMRSERIASLSRYVIADILNPAMTASEQWFERTLDDSANKRISVPEAFLAVDAILGIYTNIVSGLVVYPKMIEKHIMDELPFMMTENIMMEVTKKGGNRQELHEEIRQLSMQAGAVVKQEGKPNDLLERIAADPKFGLTMDDLLKVADPKLYIGRCPEQVTAFLDEVVTPILASHKDDLKVEEVELNV